MEGIVHWVTPLLVLPGVALLVLSTATRFVHLHGELKLLRDDEQRRAPEQIAAAVARLVQRSILFRNALISLYMAIAAFASAGLLGGVAAYVWPDDAVWPVAALSVLGIAFVTYAAVVLIRESALCLAVIQRYAEEITEPLQSP